MSRVDYNEQGRLKPQNLGLNKNIMNTTYNEQGRLQ